MKKLLISIAIVSSLLPATSLAAFPPTTNTASTFCGMDFARSFLAHVPFMFCWTKQDGGDVTFNGYLSKACSGDSCKIPNNVLTGL